MTGFLVLARCIADDVPVGLFATVDEAECAAKAVTLDQVQRVAGDSFKMDVSEVLNVTVVEMRGADLPRVVVHINKK